MPSISANVEPRRRGTSQGSKRAPSPPRPRRGRRGTTPPSRYDSAARPSGAGARVRARRRRTRRGSASALRRRAPSKGALPRSRARTAASTRPRLESAARVSANSRGFSRPVPGRRGSRARPQARRRRRAPGRSANARCPRRGALLDDVEAAPAGEKRVGHRVQLEARGERARRFARPPWRRRAAGSRPRRAASRQGRPPRASSCAKRCRARRRWAATRPYDPVMEDTVLSAFQHDGAGHRALVQRERHAQKRRVGLGRDRERRRLASLVGHRVARGHQVVDAVDVDRSPSENSPQVALSSSAARESATFTTTDVPEAAFEPAAGSVPMATPGSTFSS